MTNAPKPLSDQEQAYPEMLRLTEAQWLAKRRAVVARYDNGPVEADPAASRPLVGLALSGGGIRSATFGLGVLQALAKHGLLRRIDYLSTVSGGGYIGSFLGRLYARHFANPDVVEYLLTSDSAPRRDPRPSMADAPDSESPDMKERRARVLQVDPFRWLRQNGRYLAPNGVGDLFLVFAGAVRNWTALNLVFWSFLLIPFVMMQGVRRMLESGGLGRFFDGRLPDLATQLTSASGDLLTWSPLTNLLPPILIFAVVPLGWAFWLVERGRFQIAEPHPLYGIVVVVLVSSFALTRHRIAGVFEWWTPLFGALVTVALLSAVLSIYAYHFSHREEQLPDVPSEDSDSDHANHARIWLTRSLSNVFKWLLALAALVLIDTLAHSWLLHMDGDSGSGTSAWLAGLAAAATPLLAWLGRIQARLAAMTGGKDKGGSPPPIGLIAGVAAFLLVSILMIGLDAFAYALANGFVGATEAPKHPGIPAYALIALIILALLIGHTWPFLNRSSQTAMYTSRLARAYLGASNWRRFLRSRTSSVADSIPGDDIDTGQYWNEAVNHGGPLHLINVTVNETAAASSKNVVRDRKGVGLAVGPCGYSAGIRHHALRRDPLPRTDFPTPLPPFEFSIAPTSRMPDACEMREVIVALRKHKDDYSMFHCPKCVDPTDRVTVRAAIPDAAPAPMRETTAPGGLEEVESLSVGQWVAISGAAVSTGLGGMTSIGLSLLLGFANLRLGYWWDAGSRVLPRPGLNGFMRNLFPVQCYLIDEFTASFRGPAVPRWYLTDGGHFENMGAYELIRRRVPMIVIVDAEEDADYTYNGLGNLVRKARLDFGADIQFLDDEALKPLLHPSLLPLFGNLDSLRASGEEGFSRRHAALALVRYPQAVDEPPCPPSLLVYLKPTLSAADPADLRQYRARNRDFPQQSTVHQFFNESQWESYRKLGEMIASEVFKPVAENPGNHFVPNTLRPVIIDAGGMRVNIPGWKGA